MGLMLKIRHNLRLWSYAFRNIGKFRRFTQVPKESEIPFLTVFEVKEILEKDQLVIVDVRSENDYNDVHIEGSVNFPLFDQNDYSSLPRDKQIAVMCYGGGASLTVAKTLIENGYNASNVKGGIMRYALDVDTDLLEKF